MRILRVAPWIYPDTKGGGDYHVYAMSRDQAAMGHDVTVLTTREDESLPRVEELDGFTVVRVSPGVTLLGNDVSPAVARYLWHADSDDYDVMHAHSHCYFSTNLAALKRRLGDIPLAITNHGLYSQSAPEWLFRWYLKTLGQWTFNQADIVFSYTKTDRDRMYDLGVRTRIEIIPNGIDTDRFTPDGFESDYIHTEGPVVLFVGRLVEGKRPTLVAEAFNNVIEIMPTASLYICGIGPLQTEIEKRASELGMIDQITFLGHVPYDEMPAIYRSADVLVLPSRAEGVPRTVLEALATNIGVVTSDLPQVSETLGDTGELVSVDDGEEIAAAVIRSLQGCSNGRDRILENHSWETTVEQTTKTLQSLTNSRIGGEM